MAIAFQGFNAYYGIGVTSASGPITTTGSDVTIVMESVTNGGVAANTPTFDGVAFTQVGSPYVIPSGPGAGNYMQTWILPNAHIGAGLTLQITSAASGFLGFAVTWYSGTDSVQPDNFTPHTSSTGTSFSPSVTTTYNNSWIVVTGQQPSGTFSAGSGTVDRGQVIGYIFDSNGAVAAGSNTLNMNQTPSALATYIILGIKEKNATGAFTPTPLIHMMQITGGNM